MLVAERTETMQLMDELEALVMTQGWPVPFTGYYLVQHERLLHVVDRLRVSLQDDMDERFMQAFSQQVFLHGAEVRSAQQKEKQETVLAANRKEPQRG